VTQPSKVIAAIVSTLEAELGSDAVEVRAIAGGGDLTALSTLATPGVYVTCVRMPVSPRDYDPPAVDGRFIALCVSRDPRPGEPYFERTREDVSANLAALVQRIVSSSLFLDEDGEPVMVGQASSVASVNAFTPDLVRKGVSIWRVEWSQTFELTPRDEANTLVQLREIRMIARVGDSNTPDVAATFSTE
jgi:hypothetical protein